MTTSSLVAVEAERFHFAFVQRNLSVGKPAMSVASLSVPVRTRQIFAISSIPSRTRTACKADLSTCGQLRKSLDAGAGMATLISLHLFALPCRPFEACLPSPLSAPSFPCVPS